MDRLCNQHVAVTGHLACMSHAQAADWVRSGGGVFTHDVNQRTNLLVIGSWPLKADGRLTHKLHAAKQLQRNGAAISICSEAEFLSDLGVQGDTDQKLYNLAELSVLLRVPNERIRRWLAAGWLKPAREVRGLPFFDFEQIIGIKTLWRLTRSGVRPERVRRSLKQISGWIDTDNPLALLAMFEESGQLYVQLQDGRSDLSGQRYFDFGETSVALPITERPSPLAHQGGKEATADEWFHRGRRHEEAGQWSLAANAYRKALLIGGSDAVAAFNLANVLSAWGKNEAALERYYQALELEPAYAKAWNNLGGALVELGQFDEAIAAYGNAANLGHADSHYNLASLLEQMDRSDEARDHWQAYLNYDSESPWGRLAAERLGIA